MDLLGWIAVTFLAPFTLLSALVFFGSSTSSLRYYCCYIIYLFHFFVISLISVPLTCLNPRDVRNGVYISHFLNKISLILGIKWEIRRGDILSKDRGAIIVANHQSSLDILGMLHLWYTIRRCSPVARNEVFYLFPFGLLCWLCGVVFIDRSNRQKAYQNLVKTKNLVRDKKVKLWVFPEGTRNKDGAKTLLPFKKGAFKMAIDFQVPVIPVVFSSYNFIDHNKKHFGRGKIIVTALPEISTNGMTDEDLDYLMEKTRKAMLECHSTLRKEVINNNK